MVTVTTNSGTTSASTPTLGAVVALVMSYSRKAAAEGKIARPLTGLEAVQVLRETASDVDDQSLSWPNRPGWDLQYGYGRPNVLKAMQRIEAGDVQPVGTIDDPGWFTLFDPTPRRPGAGARHDPGAAVGVVLVEARGRRRPRAHRRGVPPPHRRPRPWPRRRRASR